MPYIALPLASPPPPNLHPAAYEHVTNASVWTHGVNALPSKSGGGILSAALHLWIPVGLLAVSLCTACCGCYITYVRTRDATFGREIQRAVDEGKVVRASMLATVAAAAATANSGDIDGYRSRISPDGELRNPTKFSPLKNQEAVSEPSPRTSEAMSTSMSMWMEDPVADTKEGWSMLTATRARLSLDRETLREHDRRQRVERARRLNRSRGRMAAYATSSAAGGPASPSVAVPSWDDEPSTKITTPLKMQEP